MKYVIIVIAILLSQIAAAQTKLGPDDIWQVPKEVHFTSPGGNFLSVTPDSIVFSSPQGIITLSEPSNILWGFSPTNHSVYWNGIWGDANTPAYTIEFWYNKECAIWGVCITSQEFQIVFGASMWRLYPSLTPKFPPKWLAKK